MPAKSLAKTKKQNSDIIRANISQVIVSAMHLLHDSDYYSSDLWPNNGFVIGWHGTSLIDDIAYINAKYWNFPPKKLDDTSLIINMRSTVADRIKEQGRIIDLILDQALMDGIFFNIYVNDKRKNENRYFLSGSGNMHLLQLVFNFTIQKQ